MDNEIAELEQSKATIPQQIEFGAASLKEKQEQSLERALALARNYSTDPTDKMRADYLAFWIEESAGNLKDSLKFGDDFRPIPIGGPISTG